MGRALLAVPLAALAAAATVATSAPAAPQADVLIRPGSGIGRVSLGMTLAQVRQALGRPQAVVRRVDYRSGGRYVEYSWELEGDRAPVTWTVGVRRATATATFRVVRVGTSAPSERTRDGLGVGSRPRQIAKVYPAATCISRWPRTTPYWGNWVVARHRNGGMTAFSLLSTRYPNRPYTTEVVEILVQRTWFSPTPGNASCSPFWRAW